LKTSFVLVLALLTLACTKPQPPKISATVTAKRKSGDTVAVTVTLRNLENRVTTPLQVSLSIQTREGDQWSKPEIIIQPAAFVLNRNEVNSRTANVKTSTDTLRTALAVKESETGHVLKDETAEISIPAQN